MSLHRHCERSEAIQLPLPRQESWIASSLSLLAMTMSGYMPAQLLRLAVLVELRDVGPEVARLFLVLDAGEDNLGAGDLRLGILDVVEELILAPGDAGILVGVGIGIALDGAGLAAIEAVEHGADLVLGAIADRVAGHALVERGLAGIGVLRQRA